MTPSRETGMYAAPGLSTPRVGTARKDDNFAALCQLLDSSGKPMLLGIDRPGRNGEQWANTAGYIRGGDFPTLPSSLSLCGDS